MANNDGPRARTVSFFRVVKVSDDQNTVERIGLTADNWETFLSKLHSKPLLERTKQPGGERLIGQSKLIDETYYALKLMSPRDETSWLAILNNQATDPDLETEDFSPGVGRDLVETTIVVFLPSFPNVIGLVRGSTASPSHTSVAAWLTAMGVTEQGWAVKAEPAMSSQTRAKLNRADGAASTSLRISTSKADALDQAGARGLGDYLRRIEDEIGELMVTVTYSIPTGKARDAARRQLLEETERLTAALDVSRDTKNYEKLETKLVFIEDEKRRHQEDVNLYEQRITAHTLIPTLDENGKVIRDDNAVRAILAKAEELEAELSTLL
jgi:hypothetical protein